MNTPSLSPAELHDIARRVCTDKQLEVIRLRESGLGWKRIALVLGVSPDTVRSHHRAAVHKIVKELQRVEVVRVDSAGRAGEAARADGGGGAQRRGGVGHQSEDRPTRSAGG